MSDVYLSSSDELIMAHKKVFAFVVIGKAVYKIYMGEQDHLLFAVLVISRSSILIKRVQHTHAPHSYNDQDIKESLPEHLAEMGTGH